MIRYSSCKDTRKAIRTADLHFNFGLLSIRGQAFGVLQVRSQLLDRATWLQDLSHHLPFRDLSRMLKTCRPNKFKYYDDLWCNIGVTAGISRLIRLMLMSWHKFQSSRILLNDIECTSIKYRYSIHTCELYLLHNQWWSHQFHSFIPTPTLPHSNASKFWCWKHLDNTWYNFIDSELYIAVDNQLCHISTRTHSELA